MGENKQLSKRSSWKGSSPNDFHLLVSIENITHLRDWISWLCLCLLYLNWQPSDAWSLTLRKLLCAQREVMATLTKDRLLFSAQQQWSDGTKFTALARWPIHSPYPVVGRNIVEVSRVLFRYTVPSKSFLRVRFYCDMEIQDLINVICESNPNSQVTSKLYPWGEMFD